MMGWAGIVGVFVPFLVLFLASGAVVRGRKLWLASLMANFISWLCFCLLTAGIYAAKSAGGVSSPLSTTGNPWSTDLFMNWDFQSAILSLAATSVVVCFHFLAKDTLERSRSTVAALGAYLGCLLGALGAGHLLLFTIFFAGSLVPRFVFCGVEGREKTIESIKETAFLGILALFGLMVVVLVFSAPFRPGLPEWFQLSSSSYVVLPGAIGFALLMGAAAIAAGIFPFHGSLRKIYELESMERAVPLALQPLLGFTILFRFAAGLFAHELSAFSAYLIGFFSVGLAYCAVSFVGSKKARERVFWLQQAMNCLVAIGFFALSHKGWHGAAVLLFFQALAVPFFLIVLSCHERRENFSIQRITEAPALALSSAAAVLFSLLLPVSVGFYGVLLVVWSLVAHPAWYLPFVVLSLPVIALAGMSSMFFQLGERESQGKAALDLSADEMLAILPIGAALLMLGLVPKLLMGPLGASVSALLSGLGISN